jgi:hypothetical protein
MTHAQPKARRKSRDVLPNISRRTLADGSRIAEVPLPRGRAATIDEADLDRLLKGGVSPAWFLNSNGNGLHYVRSNAPAAFGVPNLVQVARLIVEPPPGCTVRYLDGNRLNLRRANLAIMAAASRAKARERDFGLPAAPAAGTSAPEMTTKAA